MRKAELAEIIQNGENSGVQCKRDDVHSDSSPKNHGVAQFGGGRVFKEIFSCFLVFSLFKITLVKFDNVLPFFPKNERKFKFSRFQFGITY